LAAAAPGRQARPGQDHLAQLAERDAGRIRDLRNQAGRREARQRVDLEHELVARVADDHVDPGGPAAAERDVGAQRLGQAAPSARQIATPTELPSQVGFTTHGNPKSPWSAASWSSVAIAPPDSV